MSYGKATILQNSKPENQINTNSTRLSSSVTKDTNKTNKTRVFVNQMNITNRINMLSFKRQSNLIQNVTYTKNEPEQKKIRKNKLIPNESIITFIINVF